MTRGGILIEDGQIIDVGPAIGRESLGGVRVVDVAGRWVMPGLIDTHIHLSFDGGPRPIERFLEDGVDPGFARRLAASAETALRSGTTTIRDLGGPDTELFELRDQIHDGRVPGARLVASGRVLAPPGGHCHFIALLTDHRTDLVSAARQQLDAGADCIKVMVTGGVHTPGSSSDHVYYTKEELRAAADLVHRDNRRITGHATNWIGIERAVLAGFDSIQHGSTVDARLADLAATRGVMLVPTLSTHAAMAEHRGDPSVPTYVAAKTEHGSAGKARACRAAIEAGVTIAAGTDGGVTFVPHDGVARELAILRESGLGPMETLAAATSVAATEVGLARHIGRLAPTYAADIIVLDGDPVADVHSLGHPHLVIAGGAALPRESTANASAGRVA